MMAKEELLKKLEVATELIDKQQNEIKSLRLAVALSQYSPPKKTRGRKRIIPKNIIDELVKIEPVMKELFIKNKWRYSREEWVYIALREWQLAPSDHSAKRMQPTVIKNMITAKTIIQK